MKNFLHVAADWTSEALETACGWALYVAIAYAIFFVDVTGKGNLWSNMSSMWREGRTAPAVVKHDGVRVIKLGSPIEKRDDGISLAKPSYNYISDRADQERVVVAVNAPDPAQLTDAPADPQVEAEPRADWKRSLKGEMRNFTVYGNGEQTSSASSGAEAVKSARKEQVLAANAAVPQSAYVAGTGSPTARPSIGGRARSLSQSGSDSVRNFR